MNRPEHSALFILMQGRRRPLSVSATEELERKAEEKRLNDRAADRDARRQAWERSGKRAA